MIYDPITRQEVRIVGRLPVQNYAYRFGERVIGVHRFVKCQYGDFIAQWARERGGFDQGHVRDVDVNDLVADGGSLEIEAQYDKAPNVQT